MLHLSRKQSTGFLLALKSRFDCSDGKIYGCFSPGGPMRAAAIRSSPLEKSDFPALAGRTEQLDDDTWLSGSACRSEGADVADFDACRVGQTSTLPSSSGSVCPRPGSAHQPPPPPRLHLMFAFRLFVSSLPRGQRSDTRMGGG